MGPPLYMRSIIDWNIVVHDCNETYYHKDTHGNYGTHYSVHITILIATTPAF